jgi:hypothetical protein
MDRSRRVDLVGKEPELHDLVIVLSPADCHPLSAHLVSIAARLPSGTPARVEIEHAVMVDVLGKARADDRRETKVR